MSQPPEARAGRWFRRSAPLIVTHTFMPFDDNSEYPSMLLNEDDTDRFVFLIPFKKPEICVTSVENAVRESLFVLLFILF
jgi:hypothetical protein